LSARSLLRVLLLFSLLVLAACAGGRAARTFIPVSDESLREALTAWSGVRDRAAALASSRLLYDAKMGRGGVAAVPGTLAVTYAGGKVEKASLTGPFGARVAEYRGGTVIGDDHRAFVVDPDSLRSVLAGVWTGSAPTVAGRDGNDFLLKWPGSVRVEAVLDVAGKRLRSLEIDGAAGHLIVLYSGATEPWPERIALRDQRSGRSLSLRLVTAEPMSRDASPP
jgi:hypothetical protein